MSDVIPTSRLYLQGLGKYDLVRLVRTSELERVRRGVYAAPLPPGASDELRHRRDIGAALHDLDPDAVVSHGSAGVLHGLPIWATLGRVHVTRSRSAGGQRRRLVHVHGGPLAESDVVVIDGIQTTSLARTVLDLARTLPSHQAVAAGDKALALGLAPGLLDDGLLRMTSWPGVRRARHACGLLDARSESAGESVSRVRFVELGIPAPVVQYEVYDEAGELLARSDFGWEEERTLGEFDGRIKYERLLRPGQTGADVLFAEKRREDAIRDRGWQVVRWVWDDLGRPEVIRDRLLRAFGRTAATEESARATIQRRVRRVR